MVGKLLMDDSGGMERVTALPLAFELPPQRIIQTNDADDEGGTSRSKDAGSVEDGAQATEEAEAKAVAEDEEELSKQLLEASLARLKTLRTSGASTARYEKLASQLLADQPEHLPLLLELLAFAKGVQPPTGGAEGTTQREWRAGHVSKATARLMAAIDRPTLALYYGVSRDTEDAEDKTAAKKEAKEKGEQRKALRSALLARAAALAPETPAIKYEGAPPLVGFRDAVREMKEWVSSPDATADEEERDALARTLMHYELEMGRPGGALSTLRARMDAQTSESKLRKEMALELAALCRELELEHWASNAEEGVFRKFPVEKVPL
jgi:hypothetical protein